MVISKIWKCVESANGAIRVGVEHQKQGALGMKLSIDDFLRVWKHGMKCNNENQFGIYLAYHGVPNDSEAHQCLMFKNIGVIYSVYAFLIIKYVVLLNVDAPVLYFLCTHQCVYTLKVHHKEPP